jgi:hypothetical protein
MSLHPIDPTAGSKNQRVRVEVTMVIMTSADIPGEYVLSTAVT